MIKITRNIRIKTYSLASCFLNIINLLIDIFIAKTKIKYTLVVF